MRIKVKQSRRRPNRIILNLTSMIDVTFLLLIYFMVTMVISPPEDRLDSTLQTQAREAAGTASDFQPQVVEVVMDAGEPAYRLGARVMRDKASLASALEPLNKSTGVFIKVTDEPPVGFVVAAFQAAHDAGFEKVTYVVPQ